MYERIKVKSLQPPNLHSFPKSMQCQIRLMQMKPRTDEEPKSMASILADRVEHRILDVQTVGRDNVSLDHIERILELLSQLLVAHDLDGLSHLSKKLLQAAEQANQGSLISISHFAVKRDSG